MTEEQIEQKAEEYSDAFIAKGVAKASYIKGYNEATKELLKKWVELYKPKVGNIPPTPIQVETEQFLSEVEK